MRIVVIYLILFFFASALLSNELRVVNSDIINYPQRSLDFYYYNSSKEFISGLKKEQVRMEIDGVRIDSFSFTPVDDSKTDTISIVFSIDISERNKENLPEIRDAIIELSKYVLNATTKFSIQAYNSQSFIIQDFTNNISEITRALNLLTPFGTSNFNIGFLSPKTGSIDLAKQTKTKSIIINLTQGYALGDSLSIANNANVRNIEIYNFVFNKTIAANLKSISNLTNGLAFEDCDSNNLLDRLLYVVNKTSGLVPYSLGFDYENCNLTSSIRISADLDTSDLFETTYNQAKYPRLALNTKQINFGVVPIGGQKLDSFLVIAKNSDVRLNDIIFDTDDYDITPNYKNILLKKDLPLKFYIKLKSKTTNYKYSRLEFVTDACENTDLELVSGSGENGVEDSELKLIFPNGGEIFYSGETVDVSWEGVLDSQSVVLEYSTDSGTKWETITENAKNKTYKWIVPNLQSNQMLLRVGLPSGVLRYKNIKYVVEPDKSKKIEQAILSKDANYAGVAFDDGSIFIWDMDKSTIKRQLRDKNIGVKTFDISFGRSTNLFAASFGKDNEYDVVVWNADTSDFIQSRHFNIKPNALAWSDKEMQLYIGFENGDMAIWNMIEDKVTVVHNYGGSLNLLSISPDNKTIAVAKDNSIIFTSIDGDSLASLSLSDSILDLDWSPSGNRLSAVYDFSDLRTFKISNDNGNLNIAQNSRILRTGLPNIIATEWIDDNSVILSSRNSQTIESWGIDGTNLTNYKLHKNAVTNIFMQGQIVLSSQDTNFALAWNINDYPFSYNTLDSDVSDNTWSIVKKEIQTQKVILGDLCLNFPYYFELDDAYKNLNEPPLELDSIISSTSEIVVQNEFPILLEKGENLQLKINFLPTRKGTFENKLFVYHGATRDTITIRSRNVSADFTVLNKAISFENVITNSKQQKTEFILQNSGSNIIRFDSLNVIFGGDVFKIIKSNFDSLGASDRLYIEMQFSPTSARNYSGLLKLVSKQLCSPIYISLFGSSVEPIILYSQTVDFGIASCSTLLDTNIFIKNLSLNPIELQSSAIIGGGGIFIKNDNLPTVLNIGDSAKIELQFLDGGIGDFKSKLEILTNLTGENEKLKIDILAKRDSTNLEFLSPNLNFGVIGRGQTPSKTIKVVNKSLLAYNFDVPMSFREFELISAVPNSISKGDTAELTFKYIGTKTDTSISLLFPIGLSCNSEIKLPINIAISGGQAEIVFEPQANMGIIKCAIRQYFKHQISNTGTNNLVISQIQFEGKNANEFRLEKDYTNLAIPPDGTLEIEYSYAPNSEGSIVAELAITSNATNSSAGKSIINISGEYKKTSLSIPSDTLKFEGLKSNRRYSKSIVIKNTGSAELTPTFVNDERFVVDSIRPQVISPNQSAIVYISFLGGDIDTKYLGRIGIADDCQNKDTLHLTAEVGGSDFVSIQPETIVSKTGELININIKFDNTSNITIPTNDTIQTKLIFNSTLMVPTEEEHKGTINSKGERVINLTFPLQNKPYIYHIPAIVTLGDTSYSTIRLEQSTHLTSEFYIDDFQQGSITITNIVKDPNDRYIYGKGRAYLSGTVPSPITDIATIKYGVIENTNVNISVFDILGNKVLELVNEHKTPGDYSIKINPQSLANGNYLYKLETSSMKIIKKLTIIR